MPWITLSTTLDLRKHLLDVRKLGMKHCDKGHSCTHLISLSDASGSFGPTTAGRMDAYVDKFMENGGSFVTLAKGNRSKAVTNACKKYGGFYLGSIGGPAAILAKNCIKNVEVLDNEEDGMEAVWKIDVENFPAFIVVDDKGGDFFKEWLG